MLRPALVLLCFVVALVRAPDAHAQGDPLWLVNAQTQVSRLRIVQTDGEALDEGLLRQQIATRGPGFTERLTRRILPRRGGVYPLLPVELARDAVRLERYFVRNGFPRAEADYEVVLDTSANRARVTFRVTHGPPLVLGDIRFAIGGRAPLEELPPDVHDDWTTFARRLALRGGDRLDEFGLVDLQAQTLAWLRARGWAFADAGVERFVDETGLRADVQIKLTPGPRARFGEIVVEGLDGLPERIITRELPFRTGDRFDARQLTEGQREIFGLGLFQLALVNETPGQARDSTVDVTVRLRRGPTRVLTGFGGYYTDGGVTVRGSATHRNFLGAARQATASVEARTGILGAPGQAVTGEPIRDLRASLSLRQPYVFDRRLSLTVSPSVRDRRDEIEASQSVELPATLLFQRAPLQTLAVTAAGRYRDLSRGQGLRLLDPVGVLAFDTLSAVTGTLGADATWGRLDSPLTPRRGWAVRPAVVASGGDLGFVRTRLSGTVFVPVGRRAGVVARGVGGFLVGEGTVTPREYLLLRDQLFFSGGTGDVRGWAAARLGPKTLSVYPDAEGQLSGPGDVVYVGIGGRGRATGSVQLNLPLPLGPQWGANVFLDGGGVWRPIDVPTNQLLRATGNVTDASLADILDAEGGIRVGTGAGLNYVSPVGFISISLGVKLNPSALDLREPGAVLCGNDFSRRNPLCTGGYVGARLAGVPLDLDEIETRPIRGRLQLHFSIGQTF